MDKHTLKATYQWWSRGGESRGHLGVHTFLKHNTVGAYVLTRRGKGILSLDSANSDIMIEKELPVGLHMLIG